MKREGGKELERRERIEERGGKVRMTKIDGER